MGFFDAMRRILSSETTPAPPDPNSRVKLVEAWGLSDTSHPEFPDGRAPVADPAEMAAAPETSAFDREQWRRKLRLVLDKLPASEPRWADLTQEAGALDLDPEWRARAEIEEFTMLVRRAVADARFSPEEHRKIDLARVLIGLTDDEAEQLVSTVVREAEAFFGKSVEGA